MANISIRPQPRVYNFEIDGYQFICQIDWKDRSGVHPQDKLVLELQEVIEQLQKMPKFKVEEGFVLPPLKPNEKGSKDK